MDEPHPIHLAAPPAVTRQTMGYLRTLLSQRGIRPKNKLGQNFLIDLNLLDLVAKTAELSRDDLVLEIGSGTGSLTARLAAEAGAVLSVEVDPAFVELARENIADLPNAHVMHSDILRTKNELNPGVLEKVREALSRASGEAKFKLVANLPYAVATPAISNLLLTDLPLERMVVMVQWEIAERFISAPNTKDYGALAILVQSIADVSLVRKIAPSVFWPRPQVDSAVVMIKPNAEKRARVGDVTKFRVFLRDLYSHRRKNLRGGLVSFPGDRWSKPVVDAKLAELRIPGGVRAEDLDIETHLQLCAAFG